MLLTISKLLDGERVSEVVRLICEAELTDGKLSAGKSASAVKENLQAAQNSTEVQQAGGLVLDSLRSSQPFLLHARPKAILPPLFARYEVGMTYGRHLDNPIMGKVPLRTDLSITVFLNDAANYDGGELLIHTDFGPVKLKGNAGDAVVYPSNTIHEVTEVTRGSRMVAVTWAQSMIRSPEQRQILFDLGMLAHVLQEQKTPREFQELAERCKSNLFRMWAEV